MSLHRIVFSLAMAAGVLALGTSLSRAAEPSSKVKEIIKAKLAEKAADDAQKDDTKTDAKEDGEEEKDRYQLPEGGVKELLAFIKQTMGYRPKTQQQALQHRLRGFPALKAAAEKIKEIAKDEDKQLEGYDDAMALPLYFRVGELRTNNSPEEQKKLLEDIKAYLTSTENPSKYGLGAAQQIASSLEYGGKPEAAIEVYQDLGAIMARSKNPEVAKTGAKMEGAARRLGLKGNFLEVSGTEMDGTKFDWAKYRGKVVLVDFWATWCGPCRAELPNVKKNYELYHDKGFDVVGISLDRDRKKLEEFLEKEQNPWTTIHDGDWSDNAVATYYGVMGIPTVILVDKEGKVVSTHARGEELGKLLADQLGPAEPAEKDKSDDAAAKDEASK